MNARVVLLQKRRNYVYQNFLRTLMLYIYIYIYIYIYTHIYIYMYTRIVFSFGEPRVVLIVIKLPFNYYELWFIM
jgi:hypothetical protein